MLLRGADPTTSLCLAHQDMDQDSVSANVWNEDHFGVFVGHGKKNIQGDNGAHGGVDSLILMF